MVLDDRTSVMDAQSLMPTEMPQRIRGSVADHNWVRRPKGGGAGSFDRLRYESSDPFPESPTSEAVAIRVLAPSQPSANATTSAHVKFRKDVMHVILYRCQLDAKRGSDLLVGHATLD